MHVLKLHMAQKPVTRIYVAKTKKYASCEGDFYEIPKIKDYNTNSFKSHGEGIHPPFKNKMDKIPAYRISYPKDEVVPAETFGPLTMLWMGRRWYSSP